jgi:hypothetical protein
MRVAVAILAILVAAVPVSEAKSSRSLCRDQAQSEYKFCLKRSTTNKGRSLCKVALKKSRAGCPK